MKNLKLKNKKTGEVQTFEISKGEKRFYGKTYYSISINGALISSYGWDEFKTKLKNFLNTGNEQGIINGGCLSYNGRIIA